MVADKQAIETFKVGKFYRHTTGEDIHIVGEVETTMYGKTLVAESSQSRNLKPVGHDESSAQNWTEITKEDWMKNFSVSMYY